MSYKERETLYNTSRHAQRVLCEYIYMHFWKFQKKMKIWKSRNFWDFVQKYIFSFFFFFFLLIKTFLTDILTIWFLIIPSCWKDFCDVAISLIPDLSSNHHISAYVHFWRTHTQQQLHHPFDYIFFRTQILINGIINSIFLKTRNFNIPSSIQYITYIL